MKFDFLKKRKILIILWCIVLVAWMCFIFSNSFENAEESSDTSQGVVEIIEEIVQTVEPEFEISDNFVRKLAHFIEFFILGFIFNISYFIYARDLKYHTVLSLFFGLMISIIDETIQLTSAGRAGMIKDVWIDFSAVITSLLLLLIAIFIIKRNKLQKSL